MQSNIDQLKKKLQDTVGQLLHINKTCKCRTVPRENFQKIGDKLYHIENKSKLNWFAANKRCQKLGAHLSSLQDKDELEKVRGNLIETDYWLGINNMAIPNTEQSRKGESHCIKLQRTGSDYVMSTQECRLQFNFICEKIPFEGCQDTNGLPGIPIAPCRLAKNANNKKSFRHSVFFININSLKIKYK